MVTSSAIHTLIELAARETDDAAKRLGQALRTGQETQQKLALLQEYRADYAARFQASMAAGLSATGYRNFQLFIDKLDSAVASQQEVVREAERRIAQERNAWQASERKRLSYDTLAARARKELQKQDSRRDQKQSDAHAARQMSYKR